MIASLWYVHKHHDLQTLGPNDVVRSIKEDENEMFREGNDDIQSVVFQN
jgi:hypothetical protein